MHEQFELLPGEGVVLPRDAGLLCFGMSEWEAQWVVATLRDVRETWVCGARWAWRPKPSVPPWSPASGWTAGLAGKWSCGLLDTCAASACRRWSVSACGDLR
ncbi:hypothetical protein ABZ532_27245 [Streptomyces sp. NPDC019396]|uniref:hypothetical protein n=1 Tax=Streptomyces sp. NPDC019396 TaxID=3154687 RepID=UPI0034050B99